MKIDIKYNGRRSQGFGGFLMRTIVLTLATIIAIKLLPGVRIEGGSVAAAFITAFVIALLDNFIRPILIFITLPFTVVTLGLFIFIINAIIIEMTAAIVGPFQVDTFGYALLFSLIVTFLNYLLELPNRWLSRGSYKPRGSDKDDEGFTEYEEVE